MANVTAPVTDLNAERYARGLEIPKPPRGLRPSDDLSFMTKDSYWAVEPTGRRALDSECGRKLADEFLAYIGEYPNMLSEGLLSSIVKAMIEQVADGQKFGVLHVAFLSRINRYAMATAAVMELGK